MPPRRRGARTSGEGGGAPGNAESSAGEGGLRPARPHPAASSRDARRRATSPSSAKRPNAATPGAAFPAAPTAQLRPPPSSEPWSLGSAGTGAGTGAGGVVGVGAGTGVGPGAASTGGGASGPASTGTATHWPIAAVVDVHVDPEGQPLPPCPRHPSLHTRASHTRPLVTPPHSGSACHWPSVTHSPVERHFGVAVGQSRAPPAPKSPVQPAQPVDVALGSFAILSR